MLSFAALLLLSSWSACHALPTNQQFVLSAPDQPQIDIDWSDESIVARLRAHVAAWPEQRLVRIMRNGKEETHAVTEGDKALLTAKGLRFIDVTDHRELWDEASSPIEAWTYPRTMKVGRAHAENYFKNISTSRMKATLSEFSGFRTRHYRSEDGKKSQRWLLGQVRGIAKQHPTLDVEVTEFKHSWGQNSIIARIPARSNHSDTPAVIIGAHQDSTNLLPFLSAPGADDDGSGSTTILETFTSLIENGYKPHNASVEFHWYSAEEGGMLGSQAVVAQYKKEKRRVKAFLQQDMLAVTQPGQTPSIGLYKDFVDPDLTEFIESLASEYTDLPVVSSACGYACSDHSSWNQAGYPAAFAMEAEFKVTSHVIHSSRDTIDQPGFSFEHMAQFARLEVGLILELS